MQDFHLWPLQPLSVLVSPPENESVQHLNFEPVTHRSTASRCTQTLSQPAYSATTPSPSTLPAYEPITSHYMPQHFIQWPTYPQYPSYTPNFIPYWQLRSDKNIPWFWDSMPKYSIFLNMLMAIFST